MVNDKKLINSSMGFGKLEEVWLGATYPSKFYDHLDNEVSDVFYKITEWAEEDLSNIEKKLIELNVTVCRPEYNNIDGYMDDNDVLVKPVISPRDDTLVLGNTMYHKTYSNEDPWNKHITRYKDNGDIVNDRSNGAWSCLSPPCIVRMGKDIYIDKLYHEHVWGYITEVIVELAKEYRVHISTMGGHTDSIFCPIEDGLILTTEYKSSYNKTFPNWEIYNIFHSNRIPPTGVGGGGGNYQWYLPDNTGYKNKMFQQHIIDFAQKWVGNYTETAFDVNLLIVDEKNIIAVGEHQETFEFLNMHGYNVHAFDFRGRYFFDSGMHCLTVDVRRENQEVDLFPERGCAGLDWLLDA